MSFSQHREGPGLIGKQCGETQHRIALIVPSSNTVMENDFHRYLPKDSYTVHTDRMYLVETTREAEIAMIEQHAGAAATDLATVQPSLLVFGCTSAGSLFGLGYDARVCTELGQKAGCPTIGVVSSAAEALTRCNAARIAVITPYIDDLTNAVADALRADGREVAAAAGMGISVNVELATPTPDEIVAFSRERLEGVTFDTLFVSCTNFRAMDAVPALEDAFNVPVVTSNSATIEAVRRHFEGAPD